MHTGGFCLTGKGEEAGAVGRGRGRQGSRQEKWAGEVGGGRGSRQESRQEKWAAAGAGAVGRRSGQEK